MLGLVFLESKLSIFLQSNKTLNISYILSATRRQLRLKLDTFSTEYGPKIGINTCDMETGFQKTRAHMHISGIFEARKTYDTILKMEHKREVFDERTKTMWSKIKNLVQNGPKFNSKKKLIFFKTGYMFG